MAAFVDTYALTSMKEDVRDLLSVISPQETPVQQVLSQGSCRQTRHEWLTIGLPTGADNAHIEGSAWSYSGGQTETRLQNYTQIFTQTWKVSGTVEETERYGRGSEFDLRKLHALKALKVDIEFELLDNTASAAGVTTATARTMKGIPGACMDGGITATANSVAASRTPLDEQLLNGGFLQTMWTQGGKPNTLVVGGFVKRQIAGFVGAGAGRPIVNQSGDRVAMNVVDVYESDFGRLDILMSRYTNPGSQVLAFDKSTLTLCWLRPPRVVYPSSDGDYIVGAALAEGTLEYLNTNQVARLTRVQSA